MIRIGTAGWSIPRAVKLQFGVEGTHLQRYACVLGCAEINTSFYRSHSAATYAKWAAATPQDFRFAVKLPQSITHESALRRARQPLEQFLTETAVLGKKRGPLLVQLPPSLEYEARQVRTFFRLMRSMHAGTIVCEPRHASWFSERAEVALLEFHIGRVGADPASVPEAAVPGGWMRKAGMTRATLYYRWHGSPRKYWSRYSPERLREWAVEVSSRSTRADVWCIFDNTASGSAIENALELQAMLNPVAANQVRQPP